MRLVDILAEDRVDIARDLPEKGSALAEMARLLTRGIPSGDESKVLEVLREREALQSTGIGDGVAIPHGFLNELTMQVAALLIVPNGVPFDAIDARPATIVVGVVGPRRGAHAQLEHLKILAQISKALRQPMLRERILSAASAGEAYDVIRSAEAQVS